MKRILNEKKISGQSSRVDFQNGRWTKGGEFLIFRIT